MREPAARKILLVLEASLGGTGRHILDLARGLAERDSEVHLVYSNLRADNQFNLGLARLRSERPEIRVREIHIRRAVTLSDSVAFWRLFRYVRRQGPFDIIHGHSTKAGFIARLLPRVGVAARLYTPHALMTMDPGLRGFSRWAVCALESFLARLSSKVIVVSEQERCCALATGLTESKLALVENGVNTAELGMRVGMRAEIRRDLGIPADARCVGYVGRFCEQKEPARVLEAFALVRKRLSRQAKLVMIGFGPLENVLKVRAMQLGIDQDVIWPGPIDGAVHMTAFDVLAHCSRSEAAAYVLLEAAASGVPIVATRVGAAEELISAGGAGYICDPWSAEQFAELVFRILDQPTLHKTMSEAARKAASRFDVQAMVDKTCLIYDAVAPRQRYTQEPGLPASAAKPV